MSIELLILSSTLFFLAGETQNFFWKIRNLIKIDSKLKEGVSLQGAN